MESSELRTCAVQLAHESQNTESAPYPQTNDAQYPAQTGPLGNWIEISESPGKGLGVFALRDIPTGTMILAEVPLFLLDDECSAEGLDRKIESLLPTQQNAFHTLAKYQRSTVETENEAIVHTNTFRIKDTTGAMFAMASRFNHACAPNTDYTWDEKVERMLFMNRWRVSKGEELTVNYGTIYQGDMRKFWGFTCDCGYCSEGYPPRSWSTRWEEWRYEKLVFVGFAPVIWAVSLFYMMRILIRNCFCIST